METMRRWRDRIVGLDETFPLLGGTTGRYIHLDNAATTPPLRDVTEAIQRFLPYYSSVHRGAGFKSRVSTRAYADAHETIARFVGADLASNAVIFGKNATEAINKLAWRYPLDGQSVIISTVMEHHSNDLPWRGRAHLVRAAVTPEGRLDEAHVDRLLETHRGRVALLTVSGASNVTGFVQPIHRLARKAHAAGASILVDAAQLAPHCRIDMKPDDDPEHLDFVVLSAHKMYAPFGTGALIGRRDIFLDGMPEHRGGGMVELVTPTEVHWAGLPDREEAGTPNVVGAIAMAVAAQSLMDAGMETVALHEKTLTAHALQRLRSLPGLVIYGDSGARCNIDRIGVIAFNLGSVHHALVAAILGYEAGIGVRNGCFCAQMYVSHLLRLDAAAQDRRRHALRSGDHSSTPGMVRISFGAFNTVDDIDALVSMLLRITAGNFQGDYRQSPATGDFAPADHDRGGCPDRRACDGILSSRD